MDDREQASWTAIGLIFAFTVLSMGFVGTIVPLVEYLQHDLGATPEAIGFAIALFSAPSALLATVGGGIIDRVGARIGLVVSGLVAVIADPLVYAAHSLATLDTAFVIAGIGFAGITVAAPALIMATSRGARRSWAMSIWSTYPPAGLSLGLLLATPFTDATWRWAPVLHGAVMIILILATGRLPRTGRSDHAAAGLKALASASRDVGVIRLAIAASLPAALAYGTTLVVPGYLNRVLTLPMSATSTIAAFANLATILGGLAAGQILARNVSPLRLYGATVVAGVASQLLLFLPDTGFFGTMTGLVTWMFTIGVSIAVTMALLPHVVRDSARGAAASGVVGQFISAASFLVPNLYFGILASGRSTAFVVLAATGLVASFVVLPALRARRAAVAE